MADNYRGSTLHVHRGLRVRIDFANPTDEPSIIARDRLHVAAWMMRLPRYAAGPGETYRYEFTIDNRADTYWYDAMAPNHHTPERVYFGPSGLLLVYDTEEDALALLHGEYDLPIVIRDRDFGDVNQFTYLLDAGPDAPTATTPASALEEGLWAAA